MPHLGSVPTPWALPGFPRRPRPAGPMDREADGRQSAHVDHRGPGREFALLPVVAVGVPRPLRRRASARRRGRVPVNQPTGRGVCARAGISIRSHAAYCATVSCWNCRRNASASGSLAGLRCCARRRKVRVSGASSASRCGLMRALPTPGGPGRGEGIGVPVVVADGRFATIWPACSRSRSPAAEGVQGFLVQAVKGKVAGPRAVQRDADPQLPRLPLQGGQVARIRNQRVHHEGGVGGAPGQRPRRPPAGPDRPGFPRRAPRRDPASGPPARRPRRGSGRNRRRPSPARTAPVRRPRRQRCRRRSRLSSCSGHADCATAVRCGFRCRPSGRIRAPGSFPREITPASLSRATSGASAGAGLWSRAALPWVVTTPATSVRSLNASGIPCSSGSSPAREREWQASAARACSMACSAVTVMKAPSSGLRCPIRARKCAAASTAETWPCRSRSRSSTAQSCSSARLCSSCGHWFAARSRRSFR